MKLETFAFCIKGDSRGSLVAIESERDIPFAIKRVYYIYGTQVGVSRGSHAHKTLQQVLICVSGSCVVVMDNGKEQSEIRLSDPSVGLYIGPNTWREMRDFSSDAVLLVLASDWYDESDYIRDYAQFVAYLENQGEAK